MGFGDFTKAKGAVSLRSHLWAFTDERGETRFERLQGPQILNPLVGQLDLQRRDIAAQMLYLPAADNKEDIRSLAIDISQHDSRDRFGAYSAATLARPSLNLS